MPALLLYSTPMEKLHQLTLLLLAVAALGGALLAFARHNMALMVICLVAAGWFGLLGRRGYWD